MSATNAAAAAALRLIFENVDWANIGNPAGLQNSGVDGSFYISLHTSDPGETGDQDTNEVTTGEDAEYARVAVARGVAQWTITGTDPANVDNDNAITWTEMASGSGATATHFGIGTDSSGAGNLLFFGALDSNLSIGVGVTPEFAAGALNITLD